MNSTSNYTYVKCYLVNFDAIQPVDLLRSFTHLPLLSALSTGVQLSIFRETGASDKPEAGLSVLTARSFGLEG
jgi:hypothetical protein